MTWQQILKGVKGKKFQLFKEAVLEWSEEQDVGTSVTINEILENLQGRYYDKIVEDGMFPSAAGSHAKAKFEARRSNQVISKILGNNGWNNTARQTGNTTTRIWTKEE